MDLNLTPQDLAFRNEVRIFLSDYYPADLYDKMKLGLPIPKTELMRWWTILHEHGWIAPAWPKENGGRGLTLTQRHIFDMECRRGYCPPILPQNIAMIGPAIIEFGSHEQQQRFLPSILSGEIWFCQGYSEAQAGSDLAAVAMKAVREDDEYCVTGRKMWTSVAEDCDWIFCLVRTDTNGPRQSGITFLLVDMASPGVSVTPVIGLNGQHLWNEVTFDEVRVPAANRLGEEDKGWTVAKALLGDERIFVSRISMSTALLAQVKDIARMERADGERLIDDPVFARHITELEMRLQALDIMGLRMLSRAELDGKIGAEPSALKALGSPLVQAMDSALVEAVGWYAMIDNHKAWRERSNVEAVGPDHAQALRYNQLHHRGYTIAGGTTEIQKNIIAKAILGL